MATEYLPIDPEEDLPSWAFAEFQRLSQIILELNEEIVDLQNRVKILEETL